MSLAAEPLAANPQEYRHRDIGKQAGADRLDNPTPWRNLQRARGEGSLIEIGRMRSPRERPMMSVSGQSEMAQQSDRRSGNLAFKNGALTP